MTETAGSSPSAVAGRGFEAGVSAAQLLVALPRWGQIAGRPSQRLIAKGVHALPNPAVSDGPPLLFSSPQVPRAWELVDGEGKVFNLDASGARGVGWIGRGRGGRLEVMTTSLVFRSEVLVGNGLKDTRGRQLQSRSEYAFLSNRKKKMLRRRGGV